MDYWVQHTQMWLNNTYGNNSNWVRLEENGITGWPTIYGLIRALQIELKLSNPNGNFGPATTEAVKKLGIISKGSPDDEPSNIITIIQGALWCKGYNAGGLTGVYYTTGETAIKDLQNDIGLTPTGTINIYIWKALLNMNAFVLVVGGDISIREVQQFLNANYIDYLEDYVPCDGIAGRDTFTGLIFAIQAAEGFSADTATGFFGDNTEKSWVTVKSGDNSIFVKLLKIALYFNGYYKRGLTTLYVPEIEEQIIAYQKFMCLNVTGLGDGKTLRNLLTSNGDQSLSRPATACDCAVPLTQAKLNTLKKNGFKIVGRYITSGQFSWGNKQLKSPEANLIIENGMSIFPIYQTTANYIEYFSNNQGKADGKNAIQLAKDLGIPSSKAVYFAVDCDPTEDIIISRILPYFSGVFSEMSKDGWFVGVYGTRNVCNKVSSAGYAKFSFVSGLSSGFSGNLGFNMPNNWAFNQFQTYTFGTEDAAIEVDRDGNSGRDKGFNHLEKSDNAFMRSLEKLYSLAKEYGDGSVVESNNLCLQVLREIGGYNGTIGYSTSTIKYIQWLYVAGPIDNDFVKLVSEQIELEILKSFPVPGNASIAYDFTHFAATLHAYIHDVNDSEWTNMDYVIDRYAGWAGDLSTLAKDISKKTGNLDDIAKSLMGGDSSFGYNDYLADIDAVNLSHTLLNGTSLVDAVKSYFFTLIDGMTYSEVRTSRFMLEEYNNSYTSLHTDVKQIMADEIPMNILRGLLAGNIDQKYFDAAGKAFENFIQKEDSAGR